MSKHDEGGEGFGTPGRPERSGSGNRGWATDSASGGRRGAPGKRTATQDVGSADPTSVMMARLNVARGQIRAARSTYLPALRATITDRRMQDARTASMELRQSLATIARALDEARERTSALGSDGALALIDDVASERDALLAEAEPVLAMAPAPAPALPRTAPYSMHLDASDPDGRVGAEQHALDDWNRCLDSQDAPDGDTADRPGANVIDASGRFGRASIAVQRRAAGPASLGDAAIQRVAADGVASGGATLPHHDRIQQAFGHHDVSGISAHVGGAAADAADAIGAEAYATGDHVAFASPPSLFVAAHEAAHVVQQRAGVSLLGGVGQAGDPYEQHADAVAERVVRSESAEALLGDRPRVASAPGVQRKEADTGPASEPPYLELDPSTVSLGAVKLGERSSTVVYLHNHEDREVQVSSVKIARGVAFEAKIDGPNHIEAGGVAVLTVSFAPFLDGKDAGHVAIKTSEGFQYVLDVDGVGLLPSPAVDDDEARLPALEFSPASGEFGSIEIGRRKKQHYKAENHEDELVHIHDLVPNHPAFTVELIGDNAIDPGSSATFAVTFAPTEAGRTTAMIAVMLQDGTGASFRAEGAGVAAASREPEPAGPAVVADDPWAPDPPVVPAPRLEKPLEVSPGTLAMATTAGRETLPGQVRIFNPNATGIQVAATIEAADGKPSPFAVDDPAPWAPASEDGAVTLGVTYAPAVEGTDTATLRLRAADHEDAVSLTGTAMAAAGRSAAELTDDVNVRPMVTELPDATPPRTRRDQEAMVAAAADSLSSLAAVYQANLPPMRTAASQFVSQCGDAVANFGGELFRWLSAEGSQALESLRASDDMNYLSYALGVATAGTTSGGLIGDTIFLAIGLDATARTNAHIDDAVGNNDFLAEMMARHSSGYTRLVVNRTAKQIGRLGEADGELKQIAGPRAIGQILELSKHAAGTDPTVVAEDYQRAQHLIEEYDSLQREADAALGALAITRDQITTDVRRALPLLMDKHLEFRALGGKANPGDRTLHVSMRGTINFDSPPSGGDLPFTLALFPDSLRFQSTVSKDVEGWGRLTGVADEVGLADMSGPMRRHVRSKRLSDLVAGGGNDAPARGEINVTAGWLVDLELSSALGGEFIMSQTPDGGRTVQASSEALAAANRVGGVAAIWAALDRLTL